MGRYMPGMGHERRFPGTSVNGRPKRARLLLFEDTQYLQWLLNTGFVGVVVVVITLLLSCEGRCLFLGLVDGGPPDCKRPNRNYL
jgi:hypothetical protein